jgi:hypothetical protein
VSRYRTGAPVAWLMQNVWKKTSAATLAGVDRPLSGAFLTLGRIVALWGHAAGDELCGQLSRSAGFETRLRSGLTK